MQSLADDEDLNPDEHYMFATVTDELPVTAPEIAEGTKKDSLQRYMNIHPLAGQALA